MSMPTWEGGPPEPEPGPEAEPLPPAEPPPDGDGWAVVSLIAHNGVEPPASVTDKEAEGALEAVAAPWHPAILAALSSLPRVEGVGDPGAPGPRDVWVVA